MCWEPEQINGQVLQNTALNRLNMWERINPFSHVLWFWCKISLSVNCLHTAYISTDLHLNLSFSKIYPNTFLHISTFFNFDKMNCPLFPIFTFSSDMFKKFHCAIFDRKIFDLYKSLNFCKIYIHIIGDCYM